MNSFDPAEFSQRAMLQIHLLNCEPAVDYTIGPRKSLPKFHRKGQKIDNFENAQNRLKPTLDVYIAHTEHPLTYLERI